MTRAKTHAAARTAPAKRDAEARAHPARSVAAVRLRICANVFAHSRIHFDPGAPSCSAAATDCAGALGPDGADDGQRARDPSGDEPTTIH